MNDTNPIVVTAMNTMKYGIVIQLKQHIMCCKELYIQLAEIDKDNPNCTDNIGKMSSLMDEWINIFDEGCIEIIKTIDEQKEIEE